MTQPTSINRILLAGAAIGALAMASACGNETAVSGDTTASETTRMSSSAAVGETDPNVNPEIWPDVESPDLRTDEMEAEIAEILAGMTVEQKVGQVIQPDIGSITPDQVAEYHIGTVLNGGSSGPYGNDRAPAEDWLRLADEFWMASTGPDGTGIPALWGTDAVHGHANIIGATIFPHNIGLGAANDADLIRRIGEVTAREIAVTGIDWTFAPTVATPRDDRWGRTYEGYSEDGEIVAKYARAMVLGLQGEPGTDDFLGPEKVISTTKHFLGDGGTRDGVDQGETIATEEELRDIHNAGYPTSIEAGVQAVMASYSSWNGRKMHGNKTLLTDVLVDQMGFDGLVVGDWNGHGQVQGCEPTDCPQSFNAGLDVFMAPDSWQGLYENMLDDIEDGTISMERLDEAVSRVLRVKMRADLWNKGLPSERPLGGEFDVLGSDEHRAVAREAVRKSLVLLKNDDVLPLSASANVLVTGAGANDMGMQTGGWTISWQGDGNTREEFPNADTIFEGIEAAMTEAGGTATLSEDGSYDETPDAAIVVFGEPPYAEFRGDRSNVDFADNAGLDQLRAYREAGIPTVAVFISGRPLWVNPELNTSDAFLAAWLPGSEGAGVADVIIGDADGNVRNDFSGKLSYTWPARPDQNRLNRGDENYDPLFAYGFGLTYGDDGSLEELPTDYSVSSENSDVVFDEGGPQGPWSLSLVPNTGPTAEVDTAVVGTLNGELDVSRTDREAQEDTIVLTWSGNDGASFIAEGDGPVDWSRQANGDLAIQVDWRLDEALEGPIMIGMDCGAQCGAEYPLVGEDASVGEWNSTAIRLSCFGDLGADLSAVSRPLIISSQSANKLSVSYAGLVPSEGGTPCPQ